MATTIVEAEARRFVRKHYGPRASDIRPLGAGGWSRAYAFVLDGQPAVIRFGAHGDDFAKDAVMAAHGGPDLPIPPVWEVGTACGGFFATSARAHGTPLDALDGPGMRAVVPDVLRMLDAIRDIDTSDTSGYGGWAANRMAPCRTWSEALLQIAEPRTRLPGWRQRIDASPAVAESFDAGYRALKGLVAALPGERQIIHNDLLHGNVLVQGDRIRAVFDWGNAMYGDHLYDAALLVYWWPWYPVWADIDIVGALTRHWEGQGQAPARLTERLRCYLLHIGLDAMAYSAFTAREHDLRRNAAQVRTYLEGPAA